MEREEYAPKKAGKQHNVLPFHGNEATMNLNSLILTNIQSSSYFKVQLFKLKTYHEVIDEIYYQVKHLEPWERGSRKTSGQTGMCGGVRGVGAGGIVSTAFCLLYKLYTLKLTRKQVNGLMAHSDSPYIRALGFMYVRFTQPPGDLFDWYEEYLQDEEEIDVKAGGGQVIKMGQLVYQLMTKLEWFATLFPRIPVPIQKQLESKLENYAREYNVTFSVPTPEARPANRFQRDDLRNDRTDHIRSRSRSRDRGDKCDKWNKGNDRRGDRPERRDRYERPERDTFGSRERERGGTRDFRGERSDRYERGDRGGERGERADRGDRGERSDRYREKDRDYGHSSRDYERERDRDRDRRYR